MQRSKRCLSILLAAVLCISSAATVPAKKKGASKLDGATMPVGQDLTISLKTDDDNELRQTLYRWNINGSGNGYKAVVHLDDANGDNCEMQLSEHMVDSTKYYAIRHSQSQYYIDTEGDNTDVNKVLHQVHKNVKQDNQKFRFVPVGNEKDTYYIMSLKGDKKNKKLYIGTEKDKVGEHVKIATTNKPTKWLVTLTDRAALNGNESQLPEANKQSESKNGAAVFTMNPEGSVYDVNVNNDSAVVDGNCLHLFYTGTSSKITAEWVDKEKAYRIRSWNLDEHQLGGKDFVWDVDDASTNGNAVVHLWHNKGNSHKSQFWRFIKVKGKENIYQIYNCNSRLYLAVQNGKTKENNSKLIQTQTPQNWEITILNKTKLKTDASDWMGQLPDSMPLSDINIPGTHDAGASNMFADVLPQQSFTRAQQLYLDEQLNVGVRAWDIRVECTWLEDALKDDLAIIHGFQTSKCQNVQDNVLRVSEVMKTAKDFLAAHPKETIIMTVKGDGKATKDDTRVAEALERYIQDSKYPIWCGSNGQDPDYVPTLGEVRGKIVLIRRFSLDGYGSGKVNRSYFGLDASEWDNFNYADKKEAVCIYNKTSANKISSSIWVQDNYKEGNADTKIAYFKGAADYATENNITSSSQSSNISRGYFFNYSGATDNLSQPRSINYNLLSNSLLNRPANTDRASKTYDKKTVGIVMANYIDAKLAKRIYQTNFAVKK